MQVISFLNSINDFLWSYVIIVLLVGAALYFTVRTRGVQFTGLRDAFRVMAGRDVNPSTSNRRIGSFQAFAVSLASRVGTGNLAGVASAIFVGGPGAVFWMWMMALLGSATAFVEATLAQLYKRRGKESFYGGPAYYMERGLGAKWMGVLFSVLMVSTFGLANQLLQANTIVDAMADTFPVNKLAAGLILAAVIFVIIVGGITRISRTVSYMVPFMALGFIILALVIVCMNIRCIPDVFRLIFDGAFGLRQVGGGMVGVAIMQGVKRGLFSNEAGEGSAPNAAAIAHTSHPVKQGLVQALGVFIDTIVICTCTAFVVIIFGINSPESAAGLDGIILTTRAMESALGAAGRYFLVAAIFLFAFSTMIANYYYGETNIRYITASRWPVWVFRGFTFAVTAASAFLSLQTVWSVVDICMGLLTITNVVAIVLLAPKVFRLLDDYRRQRRAGTPDPVFRKEETMPEIAGDLEGWE